MAIALEETWGQGEIGHPLTQGLRLHRRDLPTKYAEFTVDANGGLTIAPQSGQGVRLSGLVGFATAPTAAAYIRLLPSSALTTGTVQYGVDALPLFGSDATAEGIAGRFRVETVAAAFTMGEAHGIRILTPSKGAGSTITTAFGLFVDAQTAGTQNYAIWTNTGLVRFGDSVTLPTGIELYFDGGGDTYIYESSANVLSIFCGASNTVLLAPTSVQFPTILTTASAANAFLDGANANNLLRSTSSRRYKDAIRTLTIAEAESMVFQARPVAYRSRAKADDPRREFIGLVAEDVAEVDDRFVHLWDGRPDGVAYDRLAVPMLAVLHGMRARENRLEAALRNILTLNPGLNGAQGAAALLEA